MPELSKLDPAISLRGLSKDFGCQRTPALLEISTDLPANMIVGVVGPDGAGKTTLMRILAGLLEPTSGQALVLGQKARARNGGSQPYVGYMPQRFGLYEDLSVIDNLRLHARLRDVTGRRRDELFERLLSFTDLKRFTARLAGKLSGGMKQKLGLACALIGTPKVLLLDEPGVGVDPQSRRELWSMTNGLIASGISVVWSTAYMDEAEKCPWVLMLDEGRLIHSGPPVDFLDLVEGRTFFVSPARRPGEDQTTVIRRTWRKWSGLNRVRDVLVQGSRLRILLDDRPAAGSEQKLQDIGLDSAKTRLEDVYMDVVGGIGKTPSPFSGFPPVWVPDPAKRDEPVIIAQGLSKHFGDFVAASEITFNVRPGKIFGLLGPNGAGKSTTFRMLCGLSKPSSGKCFVAGVNMLKAPGRARSRLGYMAQKFSLYGDLTVAQNIRLFGELYGMSRSDLRKRSQTLLETLDLLGYEHSSTQKLPLGQKQRLALLCAVLHGPRALFLDEPTSGVDPRTRREFWKHINTLTTIGVAVLVTTHFMEEAEYCDNIALIYRGRMIADGTPDSLKNSYRSPENADPTLEDAFIACINHYNLEHPL